MDQIFDRFERLFKSWVAGEAEELGKTFSGKKRTGDPDLDSAMDELDDFLDADREAAEARAKARAEREEAERRSREGAGRPPGGRSTGEERLAKAYQALGLPFGTPFDEVRAKYKKLLMKHHPDRHVGNAENQKKATETSAWINESYTVIETWTNTGRLPD